MSRISEPEDSQGAARPTEEEAEQTALPSDPADKR